jgi:hypothetical protein
MFGGHLNCLRYSDKNDILDSYKQNGQLMTIFTNHYFYAIVKYAHRNGYLVDNDGVVVDNCEAIKYYINNECHEYEEYVNID